MPESTRSSRAIEAFTAARKALQSTKADATGIQLKADFDVKMLGQKEAYQQDWFQYGQDALTMASTGAALYEDYSTFQKGRDELGRTAYEKDLEERKASQPKSLNTQSPFYSAAALGLEEWDDLTKEQKEEWMPQKEYDYDTTSMWGKIRKPLEDISEFLGDVDPDYVTHPSLGEKPFKASSIRAVSEIKESEELRELLGIPSQFQSNRPNIPDPLTGQQAKTAAAATSYTGTADQNTVLLKKLRNILGPTSYTGPSIEDYLVSKGLGADRSSREELWKRHM